MSSLIGRMSENDLQEYVRHACRQFGLPVQHVHDSRRSWLSGWPDLTIIGSRVLYRELKSATGSLSPEQRRVGSQLARAGQDWAVWRPVDWESGVILQALMGLTEGKPRS